MAIHQKPEWYVRNFIDGVLESVKGSIKKEEATSEGYNLYADYLYGKILIEAKAPGKRRVGREQLLEYMESFGYKLGLLIDIPVKKYYEEYPDPFQGKVGFEIYLGNELLYKREYDKDEIEAAREELSKLLQIINKLNISLVKPKPEQILSRIKEIVSAWSGKLESIVQEAGKGESKISLYKSVWKTNMELLYGKSVIKDIENNLNKLFVKLTIYTTVLKILGSTIMESILGGGRYTIPLKLVMNGYKAAVELFWERKVLTKFNINYLFDRDEYDWIFSPDIAEDLDELFKSIGKKLIEINWREPIELDLLKRVYQNILDKALRRQLGEFYTPDWLAELILWRALHILVEGRPPQEVFPENIDDRIIELIDKFYEKKKRIPRFIDPTCGSFTFGIQYINSLLKWYSKKKIKKGRLRLHPIDFANMILESVVGIDLNPVASITAKVNYLLGIYRLLVTPISYVSSLEEEPMIPVYRIDLLSLHEAKRLERAKQKDVTYYFSSEKDKLQLYIPLSSLSIRGEEKVMRWKEAKTIIKCDEDLKECYVVLSFPRSLIEKISRKLTRLHRILIGLSILGVKGVENEIDFELEDEEKKALNDLAKTISQLRSRGVNGLWYSILVSHILALVASETKFDLVVGNLPWVNLSKYPEEYSMRLRKAARDLGVYPPGAAAKKLDVSVVLFAVSAKYLLDRREKGVIGLMVPTSIFRGLHGSGWRTFFMEEGLALHEVFDLEEAQPFEKAQNQPGIVFARG